MRRVPCIHSSTSALLVSPLMYRISAPGQWASICQSPSAMRLGLKIMRIRGDFPMRPNMCCSAKPASLNRVCLIQSDPLPVSEVAPPLRNRRATIEKPKKRNHRVTAMKWARNRAQPCPQPRPRNRATIPYTHGKRLRPSRARLPLRASGRGSGCAALTLRSAGPLTLCPIATAQPRQTAQA